MTLMTQLFLSVQSIPDADMAEFFRFEKRREPLSLADRGLLRTGKKSDRFSQISTVGVLDVAAVVHMARPTSAKTFADHATQHIVPFLEYQITPTVERIDAIWDNYPEGNLKSLTHQRRGTGLRSRIGDGHTQIPKHEWNSGFLKKRGKQKGVILFP